MDDPDHGRLRKTVSAFARRWPAFRPWRQDQRADGAITLVPPEGRLRAGIYEMRLRSATTIRPRVVVDDDSAHAMQLPSISAGRATHFVHVPPGATRLSLEGVPADALQEVSLRRVSNARLAARIAMRKDAPRRRAIRALLAGMPALAIDLLGAGTEAAVADYHAWLARHEPADQGAAIAAHVSAWTTPATFTVIMAAYNSDIALLDAAIDSVVAQHYPHWRLVIADDCSAAPDVAPALARWAAADARISVVRMDANSGIAAATNAALARADADWVAFLDHDDMLAPDALTLVADTIRHHPDARILFTDEDKIDGAGRRTDPYFKPRWNRELFYAQNFLNHLTVIRRDLITDVGGLRSAFDGSQDYDLLLRCIERVADSAIIHIPFVCYHWRFTAARGNYSMTHGARARDAALRALDEHFTRTGAAARAAPVAGTPYWRAAWQAPAPLVSLIIPTRDRADLLAQAIGSILAARDAYPHFEILVADNDSTEPATLAYLRDLERRGDARVIAAPGPFNFSGINNTAAAQARGEILGFINNDVKVRDGDWLAQMVSHFARADVAAVGAKLLYGDGRVQHAGVVTGIGGVAGHLYKHRDGVEPGPFSHLVLPREVTAVTAACMLVRATAFRAAGGFDEENLAVAFNDVDLCLELRALGHRIVWTPCATLDHFESASRGGETGARRMRFEREHAHMVARWGETLADDSCYNPNRTLADESGGLAFPPRARRPWASGVKATETER